MRTALFVALLHLLMGSSLGTGLVLCVEADGTRNIESSLQESCCGDARPASHGDWVACGCEDSPVLSDATLLRSNDHGTVASHAVALIAPATSSTTSRLSSRTISPLPVRAPDSARLRTVVLVV
jgi:hypothetical protein